MTVLQHEPSQYPDSLLDDGPCDELSDGSDRCWWVLYTKAHQEKAIARDLLGREIAFYLPLVKKRLLIRRRTVHSYLPLFPGYVFLFGSPEDRHRCLATNRVSRVLRVDDPERLVFDLRQFHRLIATDAPLTVESRLDAGNRVRVRRGPFQGIEGTVQRRRSPTRLLVTIEFLHQGVSIEIEDFLLERLME
jgi:transcriptional antiterminator RfaH